MTPLPGVLLALLLLSVTGVAHAGIDNAELERARAAAAQHADDADLGFALALALVRAGELDAAVAELESVARRWPERAGECALEIGRLRYEAAEFEPALRSLHAAIDSMPLDGTARLYRALTLSALGRTDARAVPHHRGSQRWIQRNAGRPCAKSP